MNSPTFENLPKFIGITFGVVYLFGFIVVMRYLSSYGVSSITLINTQYVVAGFWLISPLVLMYALFATHPLLQHDFMKSLDGITSRRTTYLSSILLALAGPVLVILMVIVLVALGLGTIKAVLFLLADNWKRIAAIASFSIGIAFLGEQAWTSWKCRDRPRHYFRLIYLPALLVLVLIWYVLYFATTIYPHIPYSLGGGEPLPVVFLLKGPKSQFTMPLASDCSGKRTKPYELLLATDKVYVVKSPREDEKTIEINRDAVLGMVVLNKTEEWKKGQREDKSHNPLPR